MFHPDKPLFKLHMLVLLLFSLQFLKKCRPTKVEGEVQAESELRRERAVDNVKYDMDLHTIGSASYEEKYKNLDKKLEELIISKSDTSIHEKLLEQWKTECKKEKSVSIWETSKNLSIEDMKRNIGTNCSKETFLQIKTTHNNKLKV